MARKAVAQELSRERILEEARGLFATHGYRALTMRSIAKAMGYSHGALYYHFKEKAELFYALIRDDYSTLLQGLRDLMQAHPQPSVTLIRSLMLEFIRYGLDNPNHYEIMFMIDDPEVLSYSRTEQGQCLELFSTVVRGVVEMNGLDIPENQYALPWSLFMSMHGFISYCIHYKQNYEEVQTLAEEHVHFLCCSFTSSLGGSPGSRKPDGQPEGAMDFPKEKQKPSRETA